LISYPLLVLARHSHARAQIIADAAHLQDADDSGPVVGNSELTA
jgi:hypothetical protein